MTMTTSSASSSLLPNQVTLPLLSSLSKSQLKPIVTLLFKRIKASLTIAKFIFKNKKPYQAVNLKGLVQISNHFLIQGLTCSSFQIRQASSLALLNASKDFHSLICDLLWQLVLIPRPAECNIQLLALYQHFMLQAPEYYSQTINHVIQVLLEKIVYFISNNISRSIRHTPQQELQQALLFLNLLHGLLYDTSPTFIEIQKKTYETELAMILRQLLQCQVLLYARDINWYPDQCYNLLKVYIAHMLEEEPTLEKKRKRESSPTRESSAPSARTRVRQRLQELQSTGFSSAADVLARSALNIFSEEERSPPSRSRFMHIRDLLHDEVEEAAEVEREFLNRQEENDDDHQDLVIHSEDDEEIESDVEQNAHVDSIMDVDGEESEVEDAEQDGDGHDHTMEEQDDEEEDDEEEDAEEDEVDAEDALIMDDILDQPSDFQDSVMMMETLENIRSNLGSGRNGRPSSATGAVAARLTRRNTEENGPVIAANLTGKGARSKIYLNACVDILATQYPPHHHAQQHGSTSPNQEVSKPSSPRSMNHSGTTQVLTPNAEDCLLKSICDIVKPPKKPLKLKVYMRRAPTQEEFFRGSLSQNPILISSLKSGNSSSSEVEPTVKDLRQHIANDLQMADSAELLELIVANKILDMNLKLRVVAQTTWRTHVMENGASIPSESSFRSFISGSSLGESGFISRAQSSQIDENTPTDALPPMVVTYRLAGVDGEATEDKIEEGDLVDPDAPADSNSSSAEYKKKIESEYGITRDITKGRGVHVLLRSLDRHLGQVLKGIRRDDVGRNSFVAGRLIERKNLSREAFLKASPCSALLLLQYCAMIPDNRKKLVNAQAPTVLLRLMLEVLNCIDDSKNPSSDNTQGTKSGNNPTADALQALIETLSSEISSELSNKSSTAMDEAEASDSDEEEEESTLPMLLSSLRTTSLSPPLRKVIAKLLPFLTYGQQSKSKALASQFLNHVEMEYLGADSSLYANDFDNKAILMETFVETAIHLPTVAVCDTLRSELIRQGFVTRIKNHILSKVPLTPPPWSPALFQKEDILEQEEKKTKQQEWKLYYDRNGLQTAFEILIGLSKEHKETQSYLVDYVPMEDGPSLVEISHWIESTSDKDDLNTNGLGILAETLLDTLLKDNSEAKDTIDALRKKTRDRKKELAEERRKKALSKMGSFGMMSAMATGSKPKKAASPEKKKKSSAKAKKAKEEAKPAWLLEMEAMEDESGLTCAVCQEGRQYQPTELLGMYAFIRKISIPFNKGGNRGASDGTLMLLSLPTKLPESLQGSIAEEEWYQPTLDLVQVLKATAHGSSTMAAETSSMLTSRSSSYITTVTVGNAIHCSCHAKARSADRNHPKAPKSEWEGASLRNSRVTCNVILPLISKDNDKVPVLEMETSLSDHQQIVSTTLGSKPKSMLFTTLHDLRLLMFRIAYGESLSIECGGGSLSSNATLIFHNLFLADMFSIAASHESPTVSKHARGLSTGYLAASAILRASDIPKTSKMKQLRKGFAEAGPMAAICCILFHNIMNDEDITASNASAMTAENPPSVPPPKRRWEVNKDHFLRGLVLWAGRRHALDVTGSGCEHSNTNRRARATSFSDWGDDHSPSSPSVRRAVGKRRGLTIDDYSKSLRPAFVLFALLDHLSKLFTIEMNDERVDSCSQELVNTIEVCHKAENIRTLMNIAHIEYDDTKIIEAFEEGVSTV